jgi:hypothetical protein
MATFRRITSRDSPGKLAAEAARLEALLNRALEIALARSGRSRPIIRELLRNATVEGISLNSDIKAATITYPVPQFRRTWISIIPWENLADCTPGEMAAVIRETLLMNLKMTETNTWPK